MTLVTRHLIVKENDIVVEADVEIYMNDNIPEETAINFLSKDEIVNDLYERVLSGEEKVSIKTKSADELNRLTYSLGSFIRNTYGLWLSPHPYSNSRSTSADNCAEKISIEIIKQVQKRLA